MKGFIPYSQNLAMRYYSFFHLSPRLSCTQDLDARIEYNKEAAAICSSLHLLHHEMRVAVFLFVL